MGDSVELTAGELLSTTRALTPVAYTEGTDFNPAPRPPLDPIVQIDSW